MQQIVNNLVVKVLLAKVVMVHLAVLQVVIEPQVAAKSLLEVNHLKSHLERNQLVSKLEVNHLVLKLQAHHRRNQVKLVHPVVAVWVVLVNREHFMTFRAFTNND